MSYEVQAAGDVDLLRELLDQAMTRAEAAESVFREEFQNRTELQMQVRELRQDRDALIHAAASVLAELDLIRKHQFDKTARPRLTHVSKETHALLRSALARKP